MLLLRYFLCVGGALIALLLWANRYFPPPVSEAAAPDIDRTIIRIHSAQRWPAAVPIDTSMPVPTIAPAAMIAENKPATQQPEASAREALAYAAPVAPKASSKGRRRPRSISRFAARQTQRRYASSQTNWFMGTW